MIHSFRRRTDRPSILRGIVFRLRSWMFNFHVVRTPCSSSSRGDRIEIMATGHIKLSGWKLGDSNYKVTHLFVCSLKDATTSDRRCDARPTSIDAQVIRMKAELIWCVPDCVCRSPTLALSIRWLMISFSFLGSIASRIVQNKRIIFCQKYFLDVGRS